MSPFGRKRLLQEGSKAMKLLRDGNFSGAVRVLLFLLGIGIGYVALASEVAPGVFRIIFFMSAVVLCALGGYSSWAHVLGVRPFGESSWRKAKKTYKDDA